tara:strand:+ start:236 stop:622 length:387 start_codon:yes stop_codon:yes gene_type:complete
MVIPSKEKTMKKIELTEREVDLVLQCIGTNIETVKRRHPMTGSTADLIQELAEMDMDIREQTFRDDGWDAETASFPVAGDDFIQRGMDAAEQAKLNRIAAHSRAQDRRKARMMRDTVTTNISNDPVDW